VNSSQYHKLCESPQAFVRGNLKETLSALKKVNSSKIIIINQALSLPPITKPKLHQGGADTDYFKINIKAKDADEIIDELGNLVAESFDINDEPTSLTYNYESLIDKWLNYVESL